MSIALPKRPPGGAARRREQGGADGRSGIPDRSPFGEQGQRLRTRQCVRDRDAVGGGAALAARM